MPSTPKPKRKHALLDTLWKEKVSIASAVYRAGLGKKVTLNVTNDGNYCLTCYDKFEGDLVLYPVNKRCPDKTDYRASLRLPKHLADDWPKQVTESLLYAIARNAKLNWKFPEKRYD